MKKALSVALLMMASTVQADDRPAPFKGEAASS